MPMFALEPVQSMRWHAAWPADLVFDRCAVSAEDEDHARRLAAQRFGLPSQVEVSGEPWSRPDLVTVRKLVRQADGRDPPLGTVIPVMPWSLVD